MLHQILCALMGKTGSIIKLFQNQLSIDPSINYLSRPEIQLINQICRCGYHYHQLTTLMSSQFSQQSTFSFSPGKTPSMYRKAMYAGLQTAMSQYVQLILAIEQQFLVDRHFTLANLRAQLQPYELILKDISQCVQYIYMQNLKGGVVINYLYNKYENASILARRWLQKMLKQTIRIFVNQVSLWILYGQIQDHSGEFFIHKVLTQASQKYKFRSKAGRQNIQITDWDMFTLEQFMVPHSLIQIETAGKILFIGKSIKILKSAHKIPSIPDDILLNKLTTHNHSNQYSQIAFQGAIQQIRQLIARQMIQFIMKQQNLIKQLQKLNSYYLMFKGDFYHHFFEQAKGIEKISMKEKAQKRINDVYLNNTLLRLGELEDVKRFQFQLKTMGFTYSSFKNFVNLCPVGNVDLLQGKSIRFNSTGSAVWNRSKQIIQSNFTTVFTFSFKRIKQLSTNNKLSKSTQPTYLNFILQNSKQISTSIYQNPAYLNRIGQYVALKVGFEYSQKERNYVSMVMLVARDVRNLDKQKLLCISNPKAINFLDQNPYTIKLHYSNQTLKAQLTGPNTQRIQLRVDDLRLNNYIQLQMGRSYLGFISTINESDFIVDLEQWEMVCKPSTYYNSHWSDLVLNFKIDWPINLIITQDLIQAYSRIHKFLFPIRQLQIQLQSIWFHIPKLIRSQKRTTKQQVRELRLFERNLAALRSEIQLVVNNFWSYFQEDIAQILWAKLRQVLVCEKDFQDVIESVSKYVKSIQTMYFFSASKIQKKINQLIEKAKSFTIFFNNLINQNCIDQQAYNELERIDEEFSGKLGDFYGLLKDLSKINTSQYLYHITKRMEGCINPMKHPIGS